jgi:hypothetical protein
MALVSRMLLKLTCPCGHVGAVIAETLPRLLTCSRCNDRRPIGTGDCAGRVRSVSAAADAILELVRGR